MLSILGIKLSYPIPAIWSGVKNLLERPPTKYAPKPIINAKYLDRIVISSKGFYVCVSKEYIKNAPRQFIAPNHIAKIINKQTGQNYLFRGAMPEELFEMFFEIYNMQNGR